MARDRLFGMLPEVLAQDFSAVWNEFEAGEGAEAKFVSAIDRFLPLYSNYLNGGYSWKNHNVKFDKVMAKCEPPISQIPDLWKEAERMIRESVENGYLQK